MRRTRLPLVLAAACFLLVAGCADARLDGFNDRPCGDGGTLSAEWDHPGLHAALLAARDRQGAPRVDVTEPTGLPLRNETLNARWGALGLVGVTYRPEGHEGYYVEASVQQDPWKEGPLRLALSLRPDHAAEDAAQMARTLLARIELPPHEVDAHAAAIRDAYRPATPMVNNNVVSVPFTGTLDVDRLPERLFPDAEPSALIISDLRSLGTAEWSLLLQAGTLRVDATEEGKRVSLHVAADDHVSASLDLASGETRENGLARANATLARFGIPAGNLSDYQGAVAVC